VLFFRRQLLGWFLFAGIAILPEVALCAPAFEAPYLSRPIVDEVGIVAGQSIDGPEQAIRGLKDNTGVQLSVYIPSSLRDMDIESFSMTVAEQWKLGPKSKGEGADKG
jgi:uncharacterized protein